MLLCFTLAPAPAASQGPPGDTLSQVETLAAEARAAYSAGQFEAAIGYYMRAYRLEPAGALLYNIAYVYDKKLNEPELAVAYYRRYVQSSDAEPDVVERAIQRIRVLKRRANVGVVDPDTKPNPNPRPDPRPGPSGGLSGQAIAGWVTVGVGVVGVVGAGTLSLLAKDDFEAELAAQQPDLARADDLRSTGRGQALVADILWGVGGVAVAAGLVVALTADESDTRGSVNVGIGPVGDGAMITIGGSL